MKSLSRQCALAAGRFVNRMRRAMRRSPPYTISVNHPLSEDLWDRQKGLRGWVASDAPLVSAAFVDAAGREWAAGLEARSDVEFFLRYQFRHHRGVQITRPVAEWLDGQDEASIKLVCRFADGSVAEHRIAIKDPRRVRAEKFARFAGILRCPATGALLDRAGDTLVSRDEGRRYPVRDGIPDFLSDDFRRAFSIDHTENISSWDYDQKIVEIITANPDKLYLDCGAGLRKVCYPNVINYEIVNYSSTDVLGVAEKLPFADGSLDGVISVAVLEHVKDPFRSAAEISRVLKPGGVLFCAVPFLQPLHGYPHHYYNMTAEGIKNLFPGLVVDEVYVPLSLHPMQAIRWILFAYASGLPERERPAFENLRVKDIFRLPQFESFYRKEIPYIHRLSREAMSEVAAGHCLIARKPGG